MSSPSLAAIEAIRRRVTDWSQSDEALAAQLNEATEPNPAPQGTVPRFLTVARMMTECGLTTAQLQAIINGPLLLPIRDDVAAQNHDGLLTLIQCLLVNGTLDQATADAVGAWVTAQEPDPEYRALLSWAELTLGRPMDTDDLAAARAAGGE